MPEFYAGYGALITCLDSNSCPSEMGQWLRMLADAGIRFQVAGKAVWVDKDNLQKAFHQGKTFFGFDEIYLLASFPLKTPKLPARVFTSDGCQFDKEVPSALLDAMSALGCVRYLSDGTGIGMNVVCESSRTLDKVKKCIQQ